MQLSRLSYLWERYQSGALTKAERHELMEILSASSNEAVVKRLLTGEIERLASVESRPSLDDERAKEIFSRILSSESQTPATARLRPRRRWIWRAAVVLVLLSFGGYMWLHSGQNRKAGFTVSPLRNNDIAPGSNQAVLRLANGRQIVLDSTQNGQLASQGNSKVVKIHSGLLSYSQLQAKNGQAVVPQYNTLSTPPGGQYQLVLPDGSKVWLNAASSIRFPTTFAQRQRKVEITGEAYFEIAKKAEKPFIVKKGNTAIQVLGTSFNVNTYADEENMKITLITGRVKVIQHNSGNTQLLMPGQQAQISKGGDITLIKHADRSRAIAWKEGRFEFYGNIEGIMRQIARWYNVEVEYRGDVRNNAYGGAISRYEKVSKVLQMLELTGTIHFEIKKSDDAKKAGKIIVTD